MKLAAGCLVLKSMQDSIIFSSMKRWVRFINRLGNLISFVIHYDDRYDFHKKSLRLVKV